MDYREYELFVKQYFENELQKELKQPIEVKHQENLMTATGRIYNIDLNYNFKLGGINYLTIIECKNWKNTITRDLILTLREKANDLGAHKAILLTTKGFQSGAVEYALEKGVGLIKMTKAGNIEVFSNFIGKDIANIILEIVTETELEYNEEITNGFGIISPRVSVDDYIKNKYGQSVVDALMHYKERFDTSKIDAETITIINSIPENWHKEYRQIETSGFPFVLTNQRDLKIYPLLLNFIKDHDKDGC